MSVTIESDLKEILTRFENKIDNMQKDITDLKLDFQKDISEIKIELTTVKTKLDNVEDQVLDLRSTQKSQLWTIITLFGIAVIATLFRFVITDLPKV